MVRILFFQFSFRRKYLLLAFLVVFGLTAVASQESGTDIEIMNSAREAFKQNKLNEAIEIYSKIPASSDFWLDSIEERAWAHTRSLQYERALGDLKSVGNKFWAPQAGPETMMLSAFVSYKICAYKDVLEKVTQFKARMGPRIEALEKLLSQAPPESFQNWMSLAAEGKLRMSQLGIEAEKYPRFFYRDQKLIAAFRNQDQKRFLGRLRILAERDLSEIERNLKKMKVLEVEVIQRAFVHERLAKTKKELRFEKYDRNTQVSFPVSDDEIWIDEVGHYEVRAESCPSKIVKK